MRRAPSLAMCAVTGLVVVGSVVRSNHGTGAVSAAPVGVVGAGPSSAARPVPRTTPRRGGTPGPSVTPLHGGSRSAQPDAPATRTPSRSPSPAVSRPPTSVVVNGQSIDTQYGPVQVQITISGHRITKADAIDYPRGSSNDREINSYAIPQLDDETMSAQSASIDSVSGATYTSDGYRQSLQSALDNARRAGVW